MKIIKGHIFPSGVYDSIAKVENTLWKGWTEHQDSFHGHKPESIGREYILSKVADWLSNMVDQLGRTFCWDNGSFLFLGIIV